MSDVERRVLVHQEASLEEVCEAEKVAASSEDHSQEESMVRASSEVEMRQG